MKKGNFWKHASKNWARLFYSYISLLLSLPLWFLSFFLLLLFHTFSPFIYTSFSVYLLPLYFIWLPLYRLFLPFFMNPYLNLLSLCISISILSSFISCNCLSIFFSFITYIAISSFSISCNALSLSFFSLYFIVSLSLSLLPLFHTSFSLSTSWL